MPAARPHRADCCRLYLERHPQADRPAHYCYNGPAFRYQPGEPDALHPREFRQAGIEEFGPTDREEAEAEALGLFSGPFSSPGSPASVPLRRPGPFAALLRAGPMAERWRDRLRHSSGAHALSRVCGAAPATCGLARWRGRRARRSARTARSAAAEQLVAAELDKGGIEVFGARNLPEIAAGMLSTAADAKEPLSGDRPPALIEDYLEVEGLRRSGHTAKLRALIDKPQGRFAAPPSDAFERRSALLNEGGVEAVGEVPFSGEFGLQRRLLQRLRVRGGAGTLARRAGPAPLPAADAMTGCLRAVGAPRNMPRPSAVQSTPSGSSPWSGEARHERRSSFLPYPPRGGSWSRRASFSARARPEAAQDGPRSRLSRRDRGCRRRRGGVRLRLRDRRRAQSGGHAGTWASPARTWCAKTSPTPPSTVTFLKPLGFGRADVVVAVPEMLDRRQRGLPTSGRRRRWRSAASTGAPSASQQST